MCQFQTLFLYHFETESDTNHAKKTKAVTSKEELVNGVSRETCTY